MGHNTDSLVSDEMLGLSFVVSDIGLLGFLLWVFDAISLGVLLAVLGTTGAIFGCWLWYRWRTVGDSDGTVERDPPVETLKRRYATGELSESEFELQIERLLEADESTPERETVQASPERSR